MNPTWIAAIFAMSLVSIVIGFLLVAEYNAVVALRQRIDKAWSNIDVVLKQRHDQLPALVAAVRGQLAFEQEVLTEVARARSLYSSTEPIPDQAAHSDETTTAVRSLFAVVERYPDLKSQANVLDLQDERSRVVVAGADGAAVVLFAVRADHDAAPFGGELDGVTQQVVEDLLELRLVLAERRDAGLAVGVEVDVLALGERPGHVALRGDDRGERELDRRGVHAARL